MSYEGYTQYVCITGHMGRCNCHETVPQFCSICNQAVTHEKSVDMTNGYEANNPHTHEAATEVIGEEQYTMTRELHRPVGTLWREINATNGEPK